MSFIPNENIFAYYNESGQLICPECASSLLDLDTISRGQILTRDEAAESEGFYFCEVHPDDKNDQIV